MHSIPHVWQPRHSPFPLLSTSFPFSSLCWWHQNSSTDSSIHHPCSLNTCSTCCCFSSSCCFLSASLFSSSSTTHSNYSSFSCFSFSCASHLLLNSSTCCCISAGESLLMAEIMVVVVILVRVAEIRSFCWSLTSVFLCLIYRKFSTWTSGFGSKGEYCYVEFHPEHSPMFSGVLRSHVTPFHPFRPNSPFQNINTLFPHHHHTPSYWKERWRTKTMSGLSIFEQMDHQEHLSPPSNLGTDGQSSGGQIFH